MPADHHVTVYGTAVLVCAPAGPTITSEAGAADLIGEALGEEIRLVAIPSERLAVEFFELGSGFASGLTQKFASHGVGLAIIGDFGHRLEPSDTLWFCPTFDDLCTRLDRRKKPHRPAM